MSWHLSPFVRLDPAGTPGYTPVQPSAAPAPAFAGFAPSAPPAAPLNPANVAAPSATTAAHGNANELQGQAVALITAARSKSAEYPNEAAMPADVRASVNLMIDQAITLQETARQLVESGRRQKAADDILAAGRRMDPILPGLNSDASANDRADDTAARTVEVRSKASRTGVERVVMPDVASARELDAYRHYISDAPNGQQRFTYEHDGILRQKALSAGVATQGGYLVPSLVLTELLGLLRDRVWMRTAARVLPPLTQAADVAVNTVESNLSNADWTTELKAPTQDTVEPFGRRKLHPHPLNKEILVSRTLLRLASTDVESWINEQMAAAFAEPEERAYMVGHGAQQPEGLFTATTVTNITTAAAAAALTPDDIVRTEFSLKAQYRNRASWVMHRLVLLAVHLFKDGNGQYMLVPGLAAGSRYVLKGYPVLESEFAPSTIAASQDVAILGDLYEAYWIADTLNFEMQRLVEIAARNNQDSFIGRKETDGMVVRPEGLAKLRMSA